MSRSARAALLSIVVLLSLVPPVGAAQRPGQSHDFKRIPLRGPEGQRIDAHLMPRLADPGRLTVMVQMQGAPVAVRQGKAQRRGQELSQRQRAAVRRNLRARQNRITDDIADLGGDVVSKVQDAYNGVKVNIRASKIARLADLANVRAVREVQKFRPSNAQSVPFLGTPGVWEDLGLTGRNVKVGIIDTGIDYEHANFGGPGTVEAFENNDSTVIEPGSFPTAKVVGGYDFVGDDYDASSDDPAALTPQPDPDPLDCNGHGSHVGGTAGGLGVLADGSTYDGPYDESTHDNEFRVGPGVAPEADLYALRVFGCEGSTDVTVEAIDWAVENDLDVINMSLGSSFGRANDPSAAASDNAAKAGVVVVASAGNSGPGNYITGSPATATRAISVAASDSNPTLPIADLAIEGGETLTLQNSNGANVAEPITGELVVLEDDPATEIDESLGCEPESFGEAGGGDIVVTRRGICPRVDRATIGQDLGVAAVVFINDADGVPPVEGPIPGVEIPFLGATPEQGEVLIAANGETATITDAGTIDNPTFRLLASFTSNGPRMGDSFAKPDITGPGVAITSTLVGSGNEPVAISGTSMSSPHVAGVAALHREAHPRWRVEQTKAALVNTGEPQEILDYSTIRAGSGQVDPRAAVRTPVVATGEPGTASVSFGFRENRRRVDQTRPVKLTNHGRRAATFIARVDADADTDGAAHVSVSQRRITVPGHSSRTVHVRLYANLRNVATGFTPASGNVVFRPVRPVVRGSGLSGLRVPYVAVPRAVSRVETTPDNVRRRPGPDVVRLRRGQDELNFTTRNRSAVPGTADVYAWGLRDERGHLGPTDVNAVGVQAFPEEGVGVFAINTRRNVSNPSVNEWDVLLDNDDDGVPDFGVIGFDIGAILLGGFNGQLGSFTIDLETEEIVSAFFADGGGAFNTSVVLLPFLLEDVGLAPDGQTDFEYTSGVFSLEGFPDDIVTGSSRFDAYSQQVETGDFFQLDSFDRIRWSADLHQRRMRESHIRGFMVVNPGSRSGYRQATLVRVLPR